MFSKTKSSLFTSKNWNIYSYISSFPNVEISNAIELPRDSSCRPISKILSSAGFNIVNKDAKYVALYHMDRENVGPRSRLSNSRESLPSRYMPRPRTGMGLPVFALATP